MGSYCFPEGDHGAWYEGGIVFGRAEIEMDLINMEAERGCRRKLDIIRLLGIIKAGQGKVGMKFGSVFAPVNWVLWVGL